MEGYRLGKGARRPITANALAANFIRQDYPVRFRSRQRSHRMTATQGSMISFKRPDGQDVQGYLAQPAKAEGA